jgi:hypothetical protein
LASIAYQSNFIVVLSQMYAYNLSTPIPLYIDLNKVYIFIRKHTIISSSIFR